MKITHVQNKVVNNLWSLPQKTDSQKYSDYSTTSNVFSKPNILNLQAYQPKLAFGLKIGAFKELAATEAHPLWEKLITREKTFIQPVNDYRNIFDIDADRILHSGSYGRMRFKTQVFANPKNDMLSSRLTHVEQVASIAQELAEKLGLNVKLTGAIARGHDVGHTPFGHAGESKLNAIAKSENLGFTFWHEKNSIRILDDIETKVSANGNTENLNLTYAVRDGIISHCGEVDENGLRPRSEYLDLRTVEKADKISPFTWEGCVMRVSDKIAYIGKDLEDALSVRALNPKKLEELKQQIKEATGLEIGEINNSNLIKHFIDDLIKNSNPQDGLKFSEPTFKLMNMTKAFNYKEIYGPKDKVQTPYTDLVLGTIYNHLSSLYKGKDTLQNIDAIADFQPKLAKDFKNWLLKYSNINIGRTPKDTNKIIYDIDNQNDYQRSIIEFISEMTDRYSIDSFESIIFPY